jgi:hypothetical protein
MHINSDRRALPYDIFAGKSRLSVHRLPRVTSVTKIRVVLADHNAALMAAVRGTLDEKIEVVAAVENGSQAVEAVLELHPDVLSQ